jgi:hypothetical protein
MIEERKDGRPEWNNRVAWVGEIYTILTVHDEIVRLVVVFAVKQSVDRNGTPVGSELDQPSTAFLRAVQFTVRTQSKPVYSIGVTAEISNPFVSMIEPEQPPLVHCAEQELATAAIPDDATSRPLERPSNKFELPRHDYSYQTGTPGILRRVRNTE